MLTGLVYDALMDAYIVVIIPIHFGTLQMPLKRRIYVYCLMGGGSAM
jgi:hypothetical protein